MKKKKFFFLGIAAGIIIIAVTYQPEQNNLDEIFFVDATFYPEKGIVIVSYNDTSSKTQMVTLELLGLNETFHKTYYTSSFQETINIATQPKYGWKAHPVTLDIRHSDFGDVSIKTEVHNSGDPAPQTIYGK